MDAKKSKRPAEHVVISGNRLLDGRVVWLAADQAWVESIAGAGVFAGDAAAEGLRIAAAAEARQEIVGAYAVPVTLDEAGPTPQSWRERIRAQGPSITAGPQDPARQAA